MPAKAIPAGYHSVTPYLIVNDAGAAIDFYKRAFGATEMFRMAAPEGKVGHAEIKVGDSIIMIADESPNMGFRSPKTLGGSGVSLLVYVEQVDRVFKQAISAGAKQVRPLENQFYGDRSGTVQDPFGHIWMVSTHVEDVPLEEVRKRAEERLKTAHA